MKFNIIYDIGFSLVRINSRFFFNIEKNNEFFIKKILGSVIDRGSLKRLIREVGESEYLRFVKVSRF